MEHWRELVESSSKPVQQIFIKNDIDYVQNFQTVLNEIVTKNTTFI